MLSGTANFSRCGRYRYQLTRVLNKVEQPQSVTFVMLNPAQATAEKNDQTIGKCVGFAQRWGANELKVVNLYAYCTSYQSELYAAEDPVGPLNSTWLRRAMHSSERVVCAWGKGVDPKRVRRFANLAKRANVKLYCLGTNLDGSPKHPARLGYATNLVRYTP